MYLTGHPVTLPGVHGNPDVLRNLLEPGCNDQDESHWDIDTNVILDANLLTKKLPPHRYSPGYRTLFPFTPLCISGP